MQQSCSLVVFWSRNYEQQPNKKDCNNSTYRVKTKHVRHAAAAVWAEGEVFVLTKILVSVQLHISNISFFHIICFNIVNVNDDDQSSICEMYMKE